jgi:hypothetical protein
METLRAFNHTILILTREDCFLFIRSSQLSPSVVDFLAHLNSYIIKPFDIYIRLKPGFLEMHLYFEG